MIVDTTTPKGEVHIRVIEDTTGKVLRELRLPNLVVAQGRQNYALLLGGDAAASPVTQFTVGTDGTAPSMTDTSVTGTFVKAVESAQYPDNDVQFALVLEGSESNGITIREFGLLTAAGDLFARVTPAPIIKDNTIRVEATWTIRF